VSHRHHDTPVLMMVHAHPDDESSLTGGTLARYAAAGVRTILVTCTDGAQGDDGPHVKAGTPHHDPRIVAARRSAELDRAAEILGVREVIKLGYPDSGIEGDDPSSFSRLPIHPLAERLLRVMRMHQPDAIVTYPANGLSGHPDHIRTHDLVALAHRNIIANAIPIPDPASQEVVPWSPAMYHIAISSSRMRAIRELASIETDDSWVPPVSMSIEDTQITTSIDTGPFWKQKLQALAAHESQGDANVLLQLLSRATGVISDVEEYIRVHPARTPGGGGLQRDLFAEDSAARGESSRACVRASRRRALRGFG
jgi:LmbE family N-acetylglucosaminyl deacetylase